MNKRKNGRKDKQRGSGRKSSSFISCDCKSRKGNKRKHRSNLKIHGTARDPVLGANPYLNYFRQFYAKRGGKVVEAAKQAGANWRKMSIEEKAKYRGESKKKPPRVYYSRIRKLNKIFRLLTPKSNSSPIRSDRILRARKILEKWTRKVYTEVSGGAQVTKSVWTGDSDGKKYNDNEIRNGKNRVRFKENGMNGRENGHNSKENGKYGKNNGNGANGM